MTWFRPFGVTSVTLGVALLVGCGSSDDNSLFNGESGGAAGSSSGGSSSGGSDSGGTSNGGSAAGGSSSGGQAGSSSGGSSSGGSAGNGGSAGSAGSATGGSSNGGSSNGGTAGSNTGGSAGSSGGASGSGGGGTAGNSSGGTGGASGCKVNSDCGDSGQYCQKEKCDDETGQCVKRGDGCGQTQDPVCGCDGVTYWNACLAARSGVNVAAKDECSGIGTRTCLGIGGLQCPSGAKCAQIGNSCGVTDAAGVCWVIPSNCPGVVVGANYRECGPNPSASCHSLCEAIASEKPHRRDNTCPQ